MIKHLVVAGVVAALVLSVIGGFLAMIYGPGPHNPPTPVLDTTAQPPADLAAFQPPDPERAPPTLRDQVMRGYRQLMYGTPNGSGDSGREKALACRSCHFEAGRSRDGISLVGAAGRYPRPASDGRGGTRVLTLAQQVRECFRNNLGRTPPAEESPEMGAILAYLQWISAGVPVYGEVRWLGLPPLEPQLEAHPDQGRKVYAATCATCHGPGGQGDVGPALWGPGSFTSGSQFMDVRLLGSFVHRYMPFRRPDLEARTAADAAAFVLTRTRPQPGAARPPRAEQKTPPSAQGQGLPPAPAGKAEAPPPSEKLAQELRRIAQRLQEAGPAELREPGTAAAPPPAPGKTDKAEPLTLADKIERLGRPLPSLKPPKWTSGAVVHPEETKPGHGAGNMLIGIPPEGRRLPQPPGHPARTPRRADDAAPAESGGRQ